MSTKEAREALGRMAYFAGKAPGVNDLGRSLIAGEYEEIVVALRELDARRQLDQDVRTLAVFWCNESTTGAAMDASARLLSAPWLQPCDGCSVTHNAGEGK